MDAHVPYPDIIIGPDSLESRQFGDVYFAREGGLAESEHVFLKGNGLPGRWAAKGLTSHENQAPICAEVSSGEVNSAASEKNFTIAELGFGTGLNFLLTLKRFCDTAPKGMMLHYHAVEKYPLPKSDLEQIISPMKEINHEASALLARYPLRLCGPHRLYFNRAQLTLWFGEAEEWLKHLQRSRACVDAWYLDGFSPAKNPQMWTPELFNAIAHKSAPGATLATFSSAGHVRRGLEAAGFRMEKRPGFGKKRDMLVGAAQNPSPKATTSKAQRTALVLGGGIAGASLANALVQRGYTVTVLEKGSVAQGASGNAAGVLYPQLTKRWDEAPAWSFAAYAFMLRQIKHWKACGLSFACATPGMLRLPKNEEESAWFSRVNEATGLDASIVHWCDREAASKIAEIEFANGALYFPHGTWVSPKALCAALLSHPSITVHAQHEVTELRETAGQWEAITSKGERLDAAQIVIATGWEAAPMLASYGIPLQAVGGQVSIIAPAPGTPISSKILCRKGYIVPMDGMILVGATYHREDVYAVTLSRHEENQDEMKAILGTSAHGAIVGGRSAVRATTPDRMPVIGSLAPGLWVSAGHGSRGMLFAPLAAEMIASAMAGEVSPVPEALAARVSPARFGKRP